MGRRGSGRGTRCVALPESPIPNPQSLLFIPQRLQRRLVVRPSGAHAHPGFEDHLAVKQALHRLPSLGATFTPATPALATAPPLLSGHPYPEQPPHHRTPSLHT